MRLRNIPGARDVIAESRFTIKNETTYKGKWNTVFGNDHPIHIEIGMGKGQFLMTLATQNPNVNYVGIEKYSSVLLRAIEKQEREELANLYFIRMEAEYITEVFGPGEVDRIYLNFSDPWPKKGYAKRRLTHRGFLEKYRKILKENGSLFLKTDDLPLFKFSAEELTEFGFVITDMTNDLHGSVYAKDNVMTEYERNFSSAGKKINMLRAYLKGENNE